MNLPYHLFPFVVCRAAALSYGTEEPQVVENLLQTPYFQSALFLASKTFYRELEKKKFQYSNLSAKERLSVEKYANRLINRSTPFGAFAGFCQVPLSGNSEQIVIAGDIRLHLQPDFRDVLALYNTEKEQLQAKSLICTNPSAYPTPRSIRYIYYKEDEAGSRHFSIRQVENNPAVSRVIRFCREPQSHSDLFIFLTGNLEFDTQDAEYFLEELINLQLLEYAWQPNITGESFYKRLAGKLGRRESAAGPMFITPLGKKQFFALPGKDIAAPVAGHGYYANLEFNATGGLPPRVSDQLHDALFALRKLSSSADPPALTDFAREFRMRFGDRAIPLMTAIDPELGVSYGELAQAGATPPLLEGISFTGADKAAQTVPWGPLQQMLMNKWPGDKIKGIVLNSTDLDNLPDDNRKLPPSFSLPFRMAGGQLVAEAGGGNSALALIGRFTLFNASLLEKARAIAAAEQENNPEVIFAEIACITDSKTDNINHREQLRDFEIPIRTGSIAPGDRQISLSELWISVNNDQVCLWSSRHSNRIIPRLSSAYNFLRSDLPVFRLLGDMQYQGLQHSIGIDTGGLFPGLDYHPRITYRGCILALASWRFSTEVLARIPFEDQYNHFTHWALEAGLPQLFALARHDQHLVFDQSDAASMRLFLSEARRGNNLLLTEVIRETGQGSTVVNAEGKPLASQFIASVISTVPAYPEKIQKPKLRLEKKLKRDFLPGSEWLYYKIYCLPANSDQILRAIGKSAAMLLRQKKICQWFFVRYLDPEPHLRIRLMTREATAGALLDHLTDILDGLNRRGLTKSIQLDSYERETERYAAGPITRAEQVFHFSSELILRELSRPRKITTAYMSALRVVYDTIRLFILHPAERLAFIKDICDNLQRGHIGSEGQKKALELKKRELKKEVYNALQNQGFYRSCGISRAAVKYLVTLNEIAARHQRPPLQLVADLNHMHINRAFETDMRRQEMVIYTLLYQYELTVQKRQG